MKMTLIEMVQGILSAMDSDNVNSINDTVEAQQVANIVKFCYNDITSQVELPDEYTLLQLNASGDATKPCVMTIPQGYANIEWVRYNKQGSGAPAPSVGDGSWTTPDGLVIYFGTAEARFGSSSTGGNYQQYREIKYLKREDFLNEIQNFVNDQPNIVTYTINEHGTNIPLLCRNDKQPDYWTVFDNRTIVFDSYAASVETTLQTSKTMCYGKKVPTFYMLDGWTIDLDDKYTSYLFNEAKATAFVELKQQANPRAEKAARIAKIKTQKNKKAAPYGEPGHDDSPDYGRRYRPNHFRKGYYT